jgi:hypothetical protein
MPEHDPSRVIPVTAPGLIGEYSESERTREGSARYDSLFFAAFDPVYLNAPDISEICISQPPMFHYEYCVKESDSKR